MGLSKEELCRYFHLTAEQAAKELNIGSTALKRYCRKAGFNRWPYRKLSSLDSLISTLQV